MSQKLHPIISIRPPLGEPSHPPVTIYATSDEKFAEAQLSGGAKNVVRYRLDNNLQSYFDDDEERKASRNRAIGPIYELKDQPEKSRLTAWETIPTDAEKEQLRIQSEKYQALVDALVAEQDAAAPDPLSPEKLDLLQSYRNTVLACQLSEGIIGNQLGFIEEIPDIFGYGGSCLHDMNNVPNVDKVRASTFLLPADHPFHLALRFAQPLPEQRTTDFTVMWGPFRLRFEGGKTVRISMYSQAYLETLDLVGQFTVLDPLALALYGDTVLNDLLDQGRLTSEDMVYIDGLQGQIRTLQKQVRTDKIKKTDETYLPIYRQIESLKEKIAVRKKLKAQPTRAQQAAIDAQKKAQYAIYEQEINLNESSENFYGDEGIVRLTMLPQKRGFLSFVLNGQEPFTVKIPEILATKEYGSLWNDTRVILKSNGGSFDWKFLYPSVGNGEYRISNVATGFVMPQDTYIAFEGDFDASGPGCDVLFDVQESLGFRQEDPRYDFVIYLVSDATNTDQTKNEYMSWLYSVRFFINAGEVPDNSLVLWTSRDFGKVGGEPRPLGTGVGRTSNPGYPNPNKDSPVQNVTVTLDDISDSKRGMSYSLLLNDPNNTLGFRRDGFKNCMIDFSMAIYDEATGQVSGETDVTQNGVIVEAVLVNARKLKDPETGETTLSHGPDSFWRLTVMDFFKVVMDFQIQDDVIFDGLNLGQAWQRGLGLRGLYGPYVQFIPTEGVLAGTTLPTAAPGEKPRRAPRKGTRLGSVLLDLLNDFGVTDDDQELRARIKGGAFCLDVASDSVVMAYSGAPSYEGQNPVLTGAQLAQDWARFNNAFYVEGGRDRVTGKKLSANVVLYESIDDETSPIHWGTPKPAALMVRSDLDTQEDVERAAEIAAIRGSKSGNLKAYPSKWPYPFPAIGDIVSVDEQGNLELARLSGISLLDSTSSDVVTRPKVLPSF